MKYVLQSLLNTRVSAPYHFYTRQLRQVDGVFRQIIAHLFFPRETSQKRRSIPSSSTNTDDSDQDVGCCLASSRTPLVEWLGAIDLLTYILVLIFAISSWIDVNGLWVELPILVNRLPEKWTLASYIIVIVQIANIGPLLYTIAHRFYPKRIHEVPATYFIICIGATAVLLLVHFWDRTTVIAGSEHSLSLFILCGFLALVDCTSSVVFLPFMQRFPSQYMTALFIGEGFSGLIPGFVGLLQGVGSDPECINSTNIIVNETTGENVTSFAVYPKYQDPNFSVETFFYSLFAVLLLSLIAFALLNNLVCVAANHTVEFREGANASESSVEGHTSYYAVQQQESSAEPSPDKDLAVSGDSSTVLVTRDEEQQQPQAPERPHSCNFSLQLYLLLLTAWVCALTNGVLPAMQPYTCLPYGSNSHPFTFVLFNEMIFLLFQATWHTHYPCD